MCYNKEKYLSILNFHAPNFPGLLYIFFVKEGYDFLRLLFTWISRIKKNYSLFNVGYLQPLVEYFGHNVEDDDSTALLSLKDDIGFYFYCYVCTVL